MYIDPSGKGWLDGFKDTLVEEGTISESDLDLFSIIDDPQEIVDEIFNYYEQKGFEKSAAEEEILLNL